MLTTEWVQVKASPTGRVWPGKAAQTSQPQRRGPDIGLIEVQSIAAGWKPALDSQWQISPNTKRAMFQEMQIVELGDFVVSENYLIGPLL